MPISPIQIIFDSDNSYISDDSGIIVISSDEFEEENEDPNDDVDDDEEEERSMLIDLQPHHHLPLLKGNGYFEFTTFKWVNEWVYVV